jgi:UDP-N-acetylglucosamine 3-dehydrogenase
MKKRRIGILSCAHVHAQFYGRSLLQLADRAEVVGVYHEDEAEGMRFAAAFPDADYFADCGEFLDQELDGVIVCSANVDHREHVTTAVQKVPFVLCEKPLATTVEDARAIIDAARENHARLMVSYPCRYAPAAVRARGRIQNGDLGRIVGVCATNRGNMPGGWFVDLEQSGGGAIMDHTVHVADLWRWMMGTEIRTVYAEATTALHPIPVEDCGLLSVTFDNGAIGTVDTSWCYPDVHPTWGDVSIEFAGDKGVLEMDLFTQNLRFVSTRAGRMLYDPYGDDVYLLLIQDFLSMIATDGESPITGEDGLRSLEVVLAAYRSVKTRRPVNLPL